MRCQLTIAGQPSYLHATVSETRNARNALRFLEEAYEACAKRGRSAVLPEISLRGHDLDTARRWMSDGEADGGDR